MTKPEIVYDDFAKVDIRIGRVAEVQPFSRARNPSYKVAVSFADLGIRWSSAQITSYAPEALVGRQVVCVVNMPPRNIAGFKSEILILGAHNEAGDVIILSPDANVIEGGQVF
jgi:tRNA-binding protein